MNHGDLKEVLKQAEEDALSIESSAKIIRVKSLAFKENPPIPSHVPYPSVIFEFSGFHIMMWEDSKVTNLKSPTQDECGIVHIDKSGLVGKDTQTYIYVRLSELKETQHFFLVCKERCEYFVPSKFGGRSGLFWSEFCQCRIDRGYLCGKRQHAQSVLSHLFSAIDQINCPSVRSVKVRRDKSQTRTSSKPRKKSEPKQYLGRTYVGTGYKKSTSQGRVQSPHIRRGHPRIYKNPDGTVKKTIWVDAISVKGSVTTNKIAYLVK